METDKHYFIEGLFVIGFSIAAALFFLWLSGAGHRDDVPYRIFFAESVSGLTLGDPVKYHGVEVGTVKAMALDAEDPRRVQVDVALRRDAPVKTDTRAMLKLKGITGVVFIELSGGNPDAKFLVAMTAEGKMPEIPSEKSSVNAFLEQLPKVIEKFSAIEDQTKKVMTDVGALTTKVKENPSLLLRRPREKDKVEADKK
jgi:phospholipid/cholesterol/gamma-HCH transport system substrate-binding protein